MTVSKLARPYQILLFLLLVFSPVLLTGCDLARNFEKHDRESHMATQDYQDALAPRLPAIEEAQAGANSASIPALQPYIAAAPADNSKPMPLVSVSVNQSVPIRDVLFELAQQAEYDIELDPRIQGSIIFTARDRPFDEVIERISSIAGLRYKFDNDVLRVELDTPYNKTYKIDYLSYVRSNKASVRNDIAVVSGEGADTGSSFEATAESEADFWGELEVNLQQILGSGQGAVLRTQKDPRITATEQNPEVQAVMPTDASGNPIPGAAPAQPPQAVLKVESLPMDESGDSGAASSAPDAPTFAINKQAGIINVYAGDRAQKEVEAYLKLLRKSVTAQVLIEAKILEVSLNDEFSTGIDWSVLTGDFNLSFLPGGTNALGIPAAGAANPNFVIGYSSSDVRALIQALSTFGSVHALASPRMTVLNNQSAVLNVADNRVFFELDIDVTSEEGVSQVDIDSDIRNVPEGVLVNVQPSINLDNGTISMAVRPTVTRILNSIRDPAIEFAKATASPPITDPAVVSLVPELSVQEIDSVIQVNSGQPIIMGGLLKDRVEANQDKVPGLGDVPVAGNLFRKKDDTVQKTELVIFLKATILDTPGDTIHNTDKDLYRQFSGDRRPFKL